MNLEDAAARSILYIAAIMILWIVTGFFSLYTGIYPEGYSKIDLLLLIIISATYQPIAYITYKNWERDN